MIKEYMVGTLKDTPLLKVTLNDKQYFVDVEKKEVFSDEKGLPKIKDKELIKAVLEAAQ